MTTLVKLRFGSNLYGTATPLSDIDIKTVFVPPAREILTQRTLAHYREQPEKAPGEKNRPGDIELEAFALHRYLELIFEGQSLALDMLFAPDWAWTEPPHPMWHMIQHNRQRLLSRQITRFVTYARDQAKKYGIKGSRIGDLRRVLAWFDMMISLHGDVRLAECESSLRKFLTADDDENKPLQHTSIISIVQKSSGVAYNHLMCCNLKAPFFMRLSEARAIFQRVMDRYGQRALLAEKNESIDWGALSHAVRVGQQAIQLLRTGIIEFPRPERAYLLEIKQGKHPYQPIAAEIEALIAQIEEDQKASHLPDEPDRNYIDELICDIYGQQISGTL